MARRHYDQACSLADALDRIGERWSLLIVRELLLGPLRFSDLARGVGGAPTDVLTRRLRELEAEGIVRRRSLEPPASAVVYELTAIGRELEEPVLALGRWGLNFYRLDNLAELVTTALPSALRVILRPDDGPPIVVQLHSEGHATWLRVGAGAAEAGRGTAEAPDLILGGTAPDVIAAVVRGELGPAEVDGDPVVLRRLSEMVALPQRLREEALSAPASPAAATPG